MGGKSSTSTSTVQIPQEVLARYNSVNGQAQSVATPFQSYSGDPNAFVAPLNWAENAGVANTANYANAAQPAVNQGLAMTEAGSGPANLGSLNTNQYMSPFLGDVYQATLAGENQQNAQQQSALNGSAASSGAFGGDRAGVAQANLAYQQNLANNQTNSALLNQGYQQAQGVAQQQQGAQLSADQANLARLQQGGQQVANLGVAGQQAGLAGAQQELSAGQVAQQTQQAGQTALYNQFLQQQAYPFQVAQFLANIAEGTGALSGSTTSTTQPSSFFSDERLKEDIEPIGTTFDGQKIIRFRYKGDGQKRIGLSAQDVEKHHPDAVGLAGGMRYVDYDRALDKSARVGLGAANDDLPFDEPHQRRAAAGGGLIDNNQYAQLLSAQQQMYADTPWAAHGRNLGGLPGNGMNIPSGGGHPSLVVAHPVSGGQQQQSVSQGLHSAVQTGEDVAKTYKAADQAYQGASKAYDRVMAWADPSTITPDTAPNLTDSQLQGMNEEAPTEWRGGPVGLAGGRLHRDTGGFMDSTEAPGGDDDAPTTLKPAKGTTPQADSSLQDVAKIASVAALAFAKRGGRIGYDLGGGTPGGDGLGGYMDELGDSDQAKKPAAIQSSTPPPSKSSWAKTLDDLGSMASIGSSFMGGGKGGGGSGGGFVDDGTFARGGLAGGRHGYATDGTVDGAPGDPNYVDPITGQAAPDVSSDPGGLGAGLRRFFTDKRYGDSTFPASPAYQPPADTTATDAYPVPPVPPAQAPPPSAPTGLVGAQDRPAVDRPATKPADVVQPKPDPRNSHEASTSATDDVKSILSTEVPTGGGLAPPPEAPAHNEPVKPKDDRDWMGRNQDWLVPLLSGLGGMASSPSRYFGSALLQGAGAAAQGYESVQNQEATRARTGAESATYLNDIASRSYNPQTGMTTAYVNGVPTQMTLGEYRRRQAMNDPTLSATPSIPGVASGPVNTQGQPPVPSAPGQAALPAIHDAVAKDAASLGDMPANYPQAGGAHWDDIYRNAQTAATVRPQQQMLALELQSLPYGGPVTEQGVRAAKVINDIGNIFGVHLGTVGQDISVAEATEKISHQLALSQQAAGGVTAAVGFDHALQTVPTLLQSPQGRAKLVASMMQFTQQQMDMGDFAREYRTEAMRQDPVKGAYVGQSMPQTFSRLYGADYPRQEATVSAIYNGDLPLMQHGQPVNAFAWLSANGPKLNTPDKAGLRQQLYARYGKALRQFGVEVPQR